MRGLYLFGGRVLLVCVSKLIDLTLQFNLIVGIQFVVPADCLDFISFSFASLSVKKTDLNGKLNDGVFW